MRYEESRRLLSAQKGEQRDFVVSVFVPSVTRAGAPIDHERWRRETVRAMARLFGGTTSVDGFGAWRDDEAAGSVISENVSVVISFMAPSQWNRTAVLDLRRHLHRMGRETQTGRSRADRPRPILSYTGIRR